MNPLVSVVIPAHNAAGTVVAAVDSALAQTRSNLEILVVDDGSTDGTSDVLRGYGDRIRVLPQEAKGPSCARNRAAQLARGEWLAFLDADDLWREEKLERQLATAREDAGLVHTGTENFGDLSHIGRYRDTPTDRGCLFELLLLRGNFVTTSSVILRTDWFRRLGGFDEALHVCEDWDLWLRFSAEGGIMACCPEPLTRYRVHPQQANRDFRRMKDGALRALSRALAHPRAHDLERAVPRRALAEIWGTMAWRAKPVARWTAFAWYARSLWHDPTQTYRYRELLKCVAGVD
jgi:glycosyltransferase involved in cell wall biosynthesis